MYTMTTPHPTINAQAAEIFDNSEHMTDEEFMILGAVLELSEEGRQIKEAVVQMAVEEMSNKFLADVVNSLTSGMEHEAFSLKPTSFDSAQPVLPNFITEFLEAFMVETSETPETVVASDSLTNSILSQIEVANLVTMIKDQANAPIDLTTEIKKQMEAKDLIKNIKGQLEVKELAKIILAQFEQGRLTANIREQVQPTPERIKKEVLDGIFEDLAADMMTAEIISLHQQEIDAVIAKVAVQYFALMREAGVSGEEMPVLNGSEIKERILELISSFEEDGYEYQSIIGFDGSITQVLAY